MALRRLVKWGPKSVPYLLAALDDSTPTRLSVSHDKILPVPFHLTLHESYPVTGPISGGMWHTSELPVNPLNVRESLVQLLLPSPGIEKGLHTSKYLGSYTVTIGDVCFVALGQIVNRNYEAVRYQPTALVFINSPTIDHELCAQVRAVWSSDDPHRLLFDSLLRDYATRMHPDGQSLNAWEVGSLQTEAARRLLYFYPEETASVIAARLRSLDVGRTDLPGSISKAGPGDLFTKREIANGVSTSEFIKAIAWSDHRLIDAAMAELAKRTEDPELLDILQASHDAGGLEE